MSQPNIDWHRIRHLRGSQANGFEELCCLLAGDERPAGSAFTRKGTPDGGVECYATLADGSEVAWQAKYFDELGQNQIAQLDSSVTTAFEKHSKLRSYVVCLPIDLADPRVPGRSHEKDRWNEAVKRWKADAAAKGLSVEFGLWGSHELIDRLTRPQNAGRLRYWFDATVLSEDWFRQRLAEAVSAAGPRYSPELHIELPIAQTFDLLGRTPAALARVKLNGRTIRKDARSFHYARQEAESVDSSSVAESDRVEAEIEQMLRLLADLSFPASGQLDIAPLLTSVESLNEHVEVLSDKLQSVETRLRAERKRKQQQSHDMTLDRLSSFRANAYRLRSTVGDLRWSLDSVSKVANSQRLLVTGNAGTGKTHLFCDVARSRLDSGFPTVLLMGQGFLTSEPPWTQALQHLHVVGLSAQDFVDTLEAAAQAAGSRALVLVDALNEGNGRAIWPAHLGPFLALLERSPWVAVALSVRSEYESAVVPDNIASTIPDIEHDGFADREFDAIKGFFAYFGLEAPSVPLLLPEFRNPLFLKVLCSGLAATGQRRLPRGIAGITSVFDMYLAAANKKLAASLAFSERASLVRSAVYAVVDEMTSTGETWVPRERAEELVEAILPGREYPRSLFPALISEGILAERRARTSDSKEVDAVYLGYERLADYLWVARQLDLHLDKSAPAEVFAVDGPLSLVSESNRRMTWGRLEALCVQVPERTGAELPDLVPNVEQWLGFAHAYRLSVLWRDPAHFGSSAGDILNRTIKSDEDLIAVTDLLFSLAAIPKHPFNADRIDLRLRRDSLAERDTWWGISIHRMWDRNTSITRLVDWAWAVSPTDKVPKDVVDLAATALAWLLTSSNRFQRDRATKALVALLTGRLESVVRLVESFADVNDVYVVERVFAVAYGCVMKSDSVTGVREVARAVVKGVFASGTARPHILMRDYARGVVEYAAHLGARLGKTNSRARPPYGSVWPRIPTPKQMERYKENWAKASYDGYSPEWSRNRIANSVMHDDFARYVIGTNSGTTNWLSLRLSAPAWRSTQEKLDDIVASWPRGHQSLWKKFSALDNELRRTEALTRHFLRTAKPSRKRKRERDSDSASEDLTPVELPFKVEVDPGVEAAWEAALVDLMAVLDTAQSESIAVAYQDLLKNDRDEPPRFDLSQIQRYVLREVFRLGWTTKRFGHFDRMEIGYTGRSGNKAERIGKKYQWIAYHECMSLVADNFQYREWFGNSDPDRAYEGPWQEFLRDIDPSCTLRSLPRRQGESRVPWWSATSVLKWEVATPADAWASSAAEIPNVARLLSATRPADNSEWLNLNGYISSTEPTAPDEEEYSGDRRNLWLMARAYLLDANNADQFVKWAKSVDFMGRWMPEPPTHHRLFIGEHGWSAASRYFARPYYGDSGWVTPKGCPVRVRAVGVEYLHEDSGFDCSTDASFTLHLPCTELLKLLGCRWSGEAVSYVASGGRLDIFDPSALEAGPGALLVRRSSLQRALSAAGLTVCWTILGEKRVFAAGMGSDRPYGDLDVSGAYALAPNGIRGFLNGRFYRPGLPNEERKSVQPVELQRDDPK